MQVNDAALAQYGVGFTTTKQSCVDPKTDKLPGIKSPCAILNTYINGIEFIPNTSKDHPENYRFRKKGSNAVSPGWYFAYRLLDGSIIFFYNDSSRLEDIYIDLNGSKKPNKLTFGTKTNNNVTISYDDGSSPWTVPLMNGKPTKFYDGYAICFMTDSSKCGIADRNGATQYIISH